MLPCRSEEPGQRKLLAQIKNSSAPSMHWGINVTKVPFVSWYLAIGLHVPLPCEQVKLLLRKSRVDDCKWDAMERSVPCGKKRILPSALKTTSKQLQARITTE